MPACLPSPRRGGVPLSVFTENQSSSNMTPESSPVFNNVPCACVSIPHRDHAWYASKAELESIIVSMTLRYAFPSPIFQVFVSLRATPSAIFHDRQNSLRNKHCGGLMTFARQPP